MPPSIPWPPAGLEWKGLGSRVAASCRYLSQPPGRKQEMLAIARLLCALWGMMGAVQRGRDVPRVMLHIHTSRHFHTVRTGSSLSCLPRSSLRAAVLLIVLMFSSYSALVGFVRQIQSDKVKCRVENRECDVKSVE